VEAGGLSRRAIARLRLRGARVLLYHGVGELAGGDLRYAVSPTQLAGHLEQIRRAGHPVVPLARFWSGLAGDAEAPAVALTFDDGRASDYRQAFPLLLERGLVADFFVNPGTMGRAGYLGWNEAREMARAGMRFQSHAYEHVYLTPLSAALLERQLVDSKRRVEDELGRVVEFLAAPYGDVNRRVRQAARAAGYRAVCTSWDWPARAGRGTVSRVAVYAGTTPREMTRLLRGDPFLYLRRAGRSALLYPAKRAVMRLWPGRLAARERADAA
jgi:peptidoglycan/xylan/chitin deacetylase (PgdA/CDA1 family)